MCNLEKRGGGVISDWSFETSILTKERKFHRIIQDHNINKGLQRQQFFSIEIAPLGIYLIISYKYLYIIHGLKINCDL